MNENKPESLDITEDPEYMAWVESMAIHCCCRENRPCDGVLAGGLCDRIGEADPDYGFNEEYDL